MLEGMGVEGMQGESSLDILPREENVGERAGLARLALLGEREADLGEEALDPVAETCPPRRRLAPSDLLLALRHGIAKIPGAVMAPSSVEGRGSRVGKQSRRISFLPMEKDPRFEDCC